MNSKITIILIFCVAFMPYFLQCMDNKAKSSRRRRRTVASSSSSREPTNQETREIKEEEIAKESKNVKKNDENYETQATEEELCATFQYFDLNNDGVISCEELNKALGSLGISKTDEEIKLMIGAVAKDGKAVKIDEFKRMMFDTNVDEDKKIFALIDADKDGYITSQELFEYMKPFDGDFLLEHAKIAIECFGENQKMKLDGYKQFRIALFENKELVTEEPVTNK